MTLLNEANAVYFGSNKADAVYAGANKVWPASVPIGHRYWRFLLNYVQAGYSGYTMAEVQFRTTKGVPLIPSGGTPSAADTYPGRIRGPEGINPLGTYGPEKACDGSATTLWSSNAPAAPVQWWAYDYGAGNAKDIAEIAITARGDGYALYTQTPTNITPQWSDDGVTWTSLPVLMADNWTAEGQTQVFRPMSIAAEHADVV